MIGRVRRPIARSFQSKKMRSSPVPQSSLPNSFGINFKAISMR